MNKECSKCHLLLEEVNFSKDKKRRDGLCTRCRQCIKVYHASYYAKNKQKVNDRSKLYRINNSDKMKYLVNRYYLNNKDRCNSRNKRNYRLKRESRLERSKKYNMFKYKTDSKFKLIHRLRSRIKEIVKSKGFSKRKHTLELIGCSPEKLKEYIESKFLDGMNWNNHNYYGWHIDHIIPLSSAKTEEDVYKLCHYTNLQPLWAIDNLMKGNKI